MTRVEIASLKSEIRNRIRQKRQQLSTEQQKHSEDQLCEQFKQHSELRPHRKIAIYLSHDNEIGTQPLIQHFFEQKLNIYLPKLYEDNRHQLHFSQYSAESEMSLNQYQIPEPAVDKFIQIPDLDLLLLPLTAFDLKGHRLGMGGGYYDRTLAKTNTGEPLVVGLAYDFQEVEACPIEAYDQPMQMILTPSRLIDFR